jgi:hypothetical protein
MPKQGDIRQDGYIFRCNFKTRQGEIKEHWLSPGAFENWKAKRNEYNKTNYQNNLQSERQRNKKYRENNLGKANARQAKRRASKLQATPTWLTKNQINEISEFYLMAKELEKVFPWKQEVDHIEPLQGKDICGLHAPWNLQIIPMVINRSKGTNRGI